PGPQTVCRDPRRPQAGLAGAGDGRDAGGQFHHSRLDREPDRGARRRAARHPNRLLDLFRRRRASDDHHPGHGRVVAIAVGEAPARAVGRALDAVNFFVSDVRGAFGPFVNVYLVSQLHWTPGSVGVIMMVGGLIAALVILTVAGMTLYAVPGFWPVMVANAAIAVVGDVFVPAVAAVTLGLYAHRFLARRLGRNAAYE